MRRRRRPTQSARRLKVLWMSPVSAPPAPADPYTVLGIKPGSSAAAVRDAWRKSALATHPDKPDGSDEQFRAVQAAYETLRSALARRHFAAQSRGFTRDQAPPQQQQRQPQPQQQQQPQPQPQPRAHDDPWQQRAQQPPQQQTQPASEAQFRPVTDQPPVYYSTRTRWHMQFHTDRCCYGLRNATRLFEDSERPIGLEPCSICVPKRWQK